MRFTDDVATEAGYYSGEKRRASRGERKRDAPFNRVEDVECLADDIVHREAAPDVRIHRDVAVITCRGARAAR
jgi:hypothetical protein